MSATTIHVGDRVRCRPDAPIAHRITGRGTAGPITLSAYGVARWDLVGVVWDGGSSSAEMRGHLVKVKTSAA